jgi:cytidine deaminase
MQRPALARHAAVGGFSSAVCSCCLGLGVGVGMGWLLGRRGRPWQQQPPPQQVGAHLAPPADRDDEGAWLRLAFSAKAAKHKPLHSDFRVCCVLLYTDANGDPSHVVGHNSEVAPPSLHGAICAERAALLYALGQNMRSVERLYIVSDSPQPIPPGNLCREFLCEHAALGTPIISAAEAEEGGSGSSSGTYRVARNTLGSLYPFPPLLARVPRAQAVAQARRLARSAPAASTIFSGAGAGRSGGGAWPWPASAEACAALLRAVHGLARRRDVEGAAFGAVHPLSIAAGLLWADGRTELALQRKALEYGCSADAVLQLCAGAIASHEQQGAPPPVLLMQADQCGLLHAPSASARAVLAEHGLGGLIVGVHGLVGVGAAAAGVVAGSAEVGDGDADGDEECVLADGGGGGECRMMVRLHAVSVAELSPQMPTQSLSVWGGGASTSCA